MSRSIGAILGDFLSFAGYIKATSNQSIESCLDILRNRPRSSVWFGGFNTRLVIPKSKNPQQEVRFELEYYRQRSRSSRSSYAVQRIRGMFYQKGGQTRLLAKVNFTAGAVLWLWLAVALTVVSIGLLIYTGNVVMFALIGLIGSFLLAMIAVLWLDRSRLVQMVRQSMVAPTDQGK